MMTREKMSGVRVASKWNQPDNCWRGASEKLLEFKLKSEERVEV